MRQQNTPPQRLNRGGQAGIRIKRHKPTTRQGRHNRYIPTSARRYARQSVVGRSYRLATVATGRGAPSKRN